MSGYLFVATTKELSDRHCYAIGGTTINNFLELSEKNEFTEIYLYMKVKDLSESLSLMKNVISQRFEVMENDTPNPNPYEIKIYCGSIMELLIDVKKIILNYSSMLETNYIEKTHTYSPLFKKLVVYVPIIYTMYKFVLSPIYRLIY